jgi:hypothetical protein
MSHSQLVTYLQARTQGKKAYTEDARRKESMRKVHSCRLCGDDLVCSPQDLEYSESVNLVEGNITLECRHGFHDACLRGWALSGKKVTCPYCAERSRALEDIIKSNPWAKTDSAWMYFLQIANFLFVYLPQGMGFMYICEGIWLRRWVCSPLYLFHSTFLRV